MMPPDVVPVVWVAAGWIAQQLFSGSVYGGVAIALVWLLCRHIAVVPSSARAMLWWLAALKLIVALTPLPALPVPLLPPDATVTSLDAPVTTAPARHRAAAPGPQVRDTAGGGIIGPAPWIGMAMALWLLVVLAQAAKLVAAHRRLRGIVARSAPLDGDRWLLVGQLARDIGLRSVPELRLSSEIGAPQVVGVIRPVILVPPMVEAFTSDERAMTICHELMHVRRRDLPLGWIPAIAERLFFFHPLARLAAREYLVSREAACDAAVIRTLDVGPQAYGRLLVRLGIVRSEPGFAATGSSTSSSFLKRRLAMLEQASSSGIRPYVAGLAITALALTVLPIRVVARTSPPLRAEVAASPDPSRQERQLEKRAVTGEVAADLARTLVESRAHTRAQDETTGPPPDARNVTSDGSGERNSQIDETVASIAAQDSLTTIEQVLADVEEKLETGSLLKAYSQQVGEQQPAIDELLQQMPALLARQRQLTAERDALTSIYKEQHPARQVNRAEQRALEQKLRALLEPLRQQESATQPAGSPSVLHLPIIKQLVPPNAASVEQIDQAAALLRELERALNLERRNATEAPNASVADLYRQFQRLKNHQDDIAAERRKLAEQEEQLRSSERELAAQVERMFESLKRLQPAPPR